MKSKATKKEAITRDLIANFAIQLQNENEEEKKKDSKLRVLDLKKLSHAITAKTHVHFQAWTSK